MMFPTEMKGISYSDSRPHSIFNSSVQTSFANGLSSGHAITGDNVRSIGTLDMLFGTAAQDGGNSRFCIGIVCLEEGAEDFLLKPVRLSDMPRLTRVLRSL